MNRRRVLLILLAFAYAYLLNLDYSLVESPLNPDTGFTINTPPLLFLIAGYIMAAIPALWMPTEIRAPSQVAYWWLYVVVYIPSMFVPYNVLSSKPGDVIFLPLALLAIFGLLGAFYALPAIGLPKIAVNQKTFDLVWGALLGLLIVALAATHGFSPDVSFADVYKTRFEARESLPGGSLLSYTAALLYGAFVPVSLAIGLGEKKKSYVVMGIIAAGATFSLSAMKTVIYLPFLLLGVRMALRRFPAHFGASILVGAMLLLTLSMIEYLGWGTSNFSSYGSRRALFVPAQLTAYYWQYYSDTSLAMFSNGIIGQIVGTDSPAGMGETIGRVYFWNSQNNAGANIWASGFGDFSYLGMAAVTVVLGVIFRMIDGLATKAGFLTACLVSAFLGTVWAEQGLQTSFLSSGVLACLVALYFLSDARSSGGGERQVEFLVNAGSGPALAPGVAVANYLSRMRPLSAAVRRSRGSL
jgi:hypothetical protein